MFPSSFTSVSQKAAIADAYVGTKIDQLPTPSLLVNKGRYVDNCNKMLKSAASLNADFRPHVKTHKTLEGTAYQLGQGDNATTKIVVSTLMEAWNLMPLVENGSIDDILFSLPVVPSRVQELAALAAKVPSLRVMVDHPDQITWLSQAPGPKPWSVFIKINMGTNRAGFIADSDLLTETLNRIQGTLVSIYGFYCHAGHSYSARDGGLAADFLFQEIRAANSAAKLARSLLPGLGPLQISVGATPTAHATQDLTTKDLEAQVPDLAGTLELHAGNYPFLDLQQVATNCVGLENVSCSVLAEVISNYPGRGPNSPGEQLINAGVIALAREFGPVPGHGRVVAPSGYENWVVGRLSQEHGILTPLESDKSQAIPLGTKVEIVPQHSCITAASYPYYFVVEGDEVVDVWVPFRGW